MDYEKLYKEALSRARQFSEHPLQEDSDSIVEYIFPELKENEDEKIRKEIISHLQYLAQYCRESMPNVDNWIAWLEKQSDNLVKNSYTNNKDYIRYADRYSYEIWRKLMDNFKNIKDYHIGCNEVSDIVLNAIIDTFNWLEKGGDKNKVSKHVEAINEEKVDDTNKVEPKDYNSIDPHFGKTTDKVETKFKVGDFIVNDYCSGKVVKITDDAYLLDTGQGIPFSCEHNVHLWNVTKDAKDGDVLASELCGSIILFRGIKDDNIDFYCDYDFSKIDIPGDRFAVNNGQHYGNVEDSKDFHPATKEQRDTLIKAMADAGYAFDFEKKELKKIEPKSAWSEEDESVLNGILDWYKLMDIEWRNWLKSIKDRVQPKQEWKQENTDDLTDFENAMMHIGDSFFGNNAGLDPNDTNAIKEQANLLLELVPSREWSEEDEGFCIEAIKLLTNPSLYEICTNLRTEVGDWLKSIRHQNRWKPSEEQMEAVKRASNGSRAIAGKDYLIMESLYNDLEKLTE